MRRIWAIADLHLSFANPKPMEIFGEHWRGHPQRIRDACEKVIQESDLLLIPGDISWAAKRKEAEKDLSWVSSLPGIKVLAKGNHDYWWDSDKPLQFTGLHDTPYLSEDQSIGVAGIRGWEPLDIGAEAEVQARWQKITEREAMRLQKKLSAIERCRYKYVMIHYPPLPIFAPLLREAQIQSILYGHLHLNGKESLPPENWEGMSALCVAADQLHFHPRLIATLP